MRYTSCLLLSLLAFSLNSCSLKYWAYIRNLTNKSATIDILLKDLNDFRARPTILMTADQIVTFKNGHKKLFVDNTTISWLDSSHLQIQVRSKSTIDLESLSSFYNSRPLNDMQIVIRTDQTIDTLMTSRTDFRRNKFQYKQNGFRPILYYDIVE